MNTIQLLKITEGEEIDTKLVGKLTKKIYDAEDKSEAILIFVPGRDDIEKLMDSFTWETS